MPDRKVFLLAFSEYIEEMAVTHYDKFSTKDYLNNQLLKKTHF